jgi:quinol monooxygenase YgiN
MIGGLKIVVVKDGRESEFESHFSDLRQIMRSKEPDCLVYALLKSRSYPRGYIIQEQYRDQAALDAHESSEHGAVYFPWIRALLESISVEYYDGVVS